MISGRENPCGEIESGEWKTCALPVPSPMDANIANRAFDLLKGNEDKREECWTCMYALFEGSHMFCSNSDNCKQWSGKGFNRRKDVSPCDVRGKCGRFRGKNS
jgi:hypothetical protein